MSFTMTRTASETWSLTYAKYLASKVTSDMWRCSQSYGSPSQDQINNYGTELALLLRDGYVAAYEFGFQKDNQRKISWRYTVDSSGNITTDDRPGKIVSGADITDASFFNQLTYSDGWFKLSQDERDRMKELLPIQRVMKDGPKDGNGYWQQDRTYSSSGVAMPRSTFRPYSI
jgi:hypothetical protein